jgi:ppGpp synthetase/RelA/SpoT-type nucleotidyltranferase
VDQERLRAAAVQLGLFLRELLDEASIQVHSVDSRAKSLLSYQAKAEKLDEHGAPKYDRPEAEIKDTVAARVIVYTNMARERIQSQIRDACVVHRETNPGDIKHNGYDSQHFHITGVRAAPARLRGKTDLVWYLATRPGLEVQVRTVAGHAWAEYEHDVRYKPSGYRDLSPAERAHVDQLFSEAGGLRKYLDRTFDEIEAVLRPPGANESVVQQPEADLPESGADEFTDDSLRAYLAGRYPEAEEPDSDDVIQMLTSLVDAGLKTPDALEAALSTIDPLHVQSLMDYQVTPTSVRRLEDELLAALGSDYIRATVGDADSRRAWLLQARYSRVRGKILIYNVRGLPGVPESVPMSSARTFREIVRVVAEQSGVEGAQLAGAVSLANDLDVSARARQLKTPAGRLWVHSNLSRALAEQYIAALLEKLPNRGITVYRAGEEILRTPDGC